MLEDIFMEESPEVFDDDNVPCFGEYGNWPECKDCILRKKCKKFTETEKQVSLRYKGKYTGTGKERRRDKY